MQSVQEQARRRAPPSEALRGLDTTPEQTDAYSVILVSSTVTATALAEVCIPFFCKLTSL